MKKAKHVIGLRCPECGHVWEGHAMIGTAYATCPICSEGSEDYQLDRVPAGEPYEGSREVPGCDKHSTTLPCPYCRQSWLAVWGFASTGSEVGILGGPYSREQASEAVAEFDRTNENQAAGAWIREVEDAT